MRCYELLISVITLLPVEPPGGGETDFEILIRVFSMRIKFVFEGGDRAGCEDESEDFLYDEMDEIAVLYNFYNSKPGS